MQRLEPIEIVCGVDTAYAPHLGVMLRSVEATQSRPVRAHVLHGVMDPEVQQRVAAAAPSIDIIWYPIAEEAVVGLSPLLQISRATYFRLFLEDVLSSAITRVLYLDVDVIVADRLDCLWDLDIGSAHCAAVSDPGVSADDFARKFSLEEGGRYFNAGVLLLDLERLRQGGALKSALALLLDDRDRYEYADQDALNITLWKRWLEVDARWNFQRRLLYPENEVRTPLACDGNHPAIIHFTERQKPWEGSEWHPYAWLYLKSLWGTSFRSAVMQDGGIGLLHYIKWFLRYRLRAPHRR